MKNERVKIDLKCFDIWSVGMVIYCCFTDNWIKRQHCKQMNWITDVYQMSLFKSLQDPLFSELLKRAPPSCEINDDDCSHLQNVLRGILRYNSENRPNATELLEHPLLSESSSSGILLETHMMWIKMLTELEF